MGANKEEKIEEKWVREKIEGKLTELRNRPRNRILRPELDL
jgi:hypothetical protein